MKLCCVCNISASNRWLRRSGQLFALIYISGVWSPSHHHIDGRYSWITFALCCMDQCTPRFLLNSYSFSRMLPLVLLRSPFIICCVQVLELSILLHRRINGPKSLNFPSNGHMREQGAKLWIDGNTTRRIMFFSSE